MTSEQILIIVINVIVIGAVNFFINGYLLGKKIEKALEENNRKQIEEIVSIALSTNKKRF